MVKVLGVLELICPNAWMDWTKLKTTNILN
jgi:hypothetical protein